MAQFLKLSRWIQVAASDSAFRIHLLLVLILCVVLPGLAPSENSTECVLSVLIFNILSLEFLAMKTTTQYSMSQWESVCVCVYLVFPDLYSVFSLETDTEQHGIVLPSCGYLLATINWILNNLKSKFFWNCTLVFKDK